VENGPSAAALTIPGVGWGLPGSGEPTGHHRGFADRRPRTHRRRRRDGCRAVLLLSPITRLIGRGDTTRSRRSRTPVRPTTWRRQPDARRRSRRWSPCWRAAKPSFSGPRV